MVNNVGAFAPFIKGANMVNINPVGLAQEKQRFRDERQQKMLNERFEAIEKRLDKLEKKEKVLKKTEKPKEEV